MWGVFDERKIEDYGSNILEVRRIVPRLLAMFHEFNIQATFATVGILFADQKNKLSNFIPKVTPEFKDASLSPYTKQIKLIGNNELEDQYHYAYSIIELIESYEVHEIGTHTFCHYYCLEEGATIESFKADLDAAIRIAESIGIVITSIVFPRNQFNPEYLEVCYELGIIAYRGNARHSIYKGRGKNDDKSYLRALRLLDAYINISTNNCYNLNNLKTEYPINIPASRFLRPYLKPLKFLESIRLKRILNEMTYAAKEGLLYHLWWHPHNFGSATEQNFSFLEKILNHYKRLNEINKFESITMSNLARELKNG